MKKVIFVGGSSFSGSTLLDMVLSNDPNGLSLGEIYALRYPFRKHHIRERINLVKYDARWKTIINAPIQQFYPNLFAMFPEKDFVVDSSKNPIWIHRNINALKEQAVETYNVLIYKDPVEIAASFIKRKRGREWTRSWIRYHKLYFSLIEDFDIISYKELVSEPNTLSNICENLGLSYSKEKLQFWDKKQPTFFGNNRTRYHTFQKKEELNDFTMKNSASYDPSEYRKIYYKEITDLKIINAVAKIQEKDPSIGQIADFLKRKRANKELEIAGTMKLDFPAMFLRQVKMEARNRLYRAKELFYSYF